MFVCFLDVAKSNSPFKDLCSSAVFWFTWLFVGVFLGVIKKSFSKFNSDPCQWKESRS